MRWGAAVAAVAVAGALAFGAVRAPMATEATGPVSEPLAAAPSADGGGRYEMPLLGEVVAYFDDPSVPWGAGHRGVDIAGAAGVAVLAAGEGVVAFVGVVVDRPVVSIDHPDGNRTTYEPVVGVVEVGDAVGRGEVIGRLSAEASHCAPAVCLHWGAKIGDDYLDPLSLLSDPVIRLYPVSGSLDGSGAGVGLAEGGPQPFGADVRVALGGGEGGVPEHLLDRAQVGAAVQEMGGGGVPQAVGGEVAHTRERGESVHGLAHLAHVEPAAAGAEEERVRAGGGGQPRARGQPVA